MQVEFLWIKKTKKKLLIVYIRFDLVKSYIKI